VTEPDAKEQAAEVPPCPFCGDTKITTCLADNPILEAMDNGIFTAFAACLTCRAQGPLAVHTNQRDVLVLARYLWLSGNYDITPIKAMEAFYVQFPMGGKHD
jgi:hypothetical protein